MTLPKNFTRDVILKAPSKDIMNTLTKSILTLASYDDKHLIFLWKCIKTMSDVDQCFADDGSLWISWLQSLRQ